MLEGVSQVKQLREDEKNRHGELLAALSAIEIGCAKLASQVTGQGTQSTMEAQPPVSPAPAGGIGEYQAAPMASAPVAPVAAGRPVGSMGTPTPHAGRFPGYGAVALPLILHSRPSSMVGSSANAFEHAEPCSIPSGIRRGTAVSSAGEHGLSTVSIGDMVFRILPQFPSDAVSMPTQ